MFCVNCFTADDLTPLYKKTWNGQRKEWQMHYKASICRTCLAADPAELVARNKKHAMSASNVADLRVRLSTGAA